MIKEISATHLHEKMKSESCNIIDVRERVEFATGHVPTAVKIKLIISSAKVVHVLDRLAFFLRHKAIMLSILLVVLRHGLEY